MNSTRKIPKETNNGSVPAGADVLGDAHEPMGINRDALDFDPPENGK
jgi:hypothetical protein